VIYEAALYLPDIEHGQSPSLFSPYDGGIRHRAQVNVLKRMLDTIEVLN
jgi:hypothetical protein